MVKYTKQRKSLRRTRRKIPKSRKNRNRKRRGGGAPIGENGGNFGTPPKDYPVGQTGALPDPLATLPTGKSDY